MVKIKPLHRFADADFGGGAPPPPDGPRYAWLKRHGWLLTLILAAVAALGTWVNAVYKPLPPAAVVGPATAGATPAAPLDPEAQKKSDRLARAAAPHKLEVEKHPDVTSFLFADYEDPEPGQYRGWVYIYAGTKSHFVELERQSCSYPDGTRISVDFAQRTMLMSCDFPDFMTSKDKGEKAISTGIVTIRFFDNDEKVYGNFACSCEHMILSNPTFDLSKRTLDVTVASGVEFGGGPSARIVIKRGEDEYSIRTRTTYDGNWDAISFGRLR